MFEVGEAFGANGRYVVIEKLGQGGFGVTLKIRDTLQDEICVLKMMRHEYLSEAGMSQEQIEDALRREAKRLKFFKHENIPGFGGYDVVYDKQGRAWHVLIQEYIEGKNYRSILDEDGPLSLMTALDVLEQVLQILVYLHQIKDELGQPSPVLHLDIKPDNLMVRSSDGRLFLIDFGLAVQRQSAQGKRSPTAFSLSGAGTEGYMSPEQAQGRATTASDLFALGITFLEMYSGQPAPKIARKIAPNDQPDSIISLPSRVNTLIREMIRYREAERLQDARVALHRLQLIRRQSQDDTKVRFDPKPPKREGGKTRLLLVMVLSAVLLLALLVWWVGSVGRFLPGFAGTKPMSQPDAESHTPELVPWLPEKRPEPTLNPGDRKLIAGLPGAYARYIPPGTFRMGSIKGRKNEQPMRTVKISVGFWMKETEVSQAEFKLMGKGKRRSYFKNCGKKCPREMVSWSEAAEFANRLSAKTGLETCFKKKHRKWAAKSYKKYVECKGWRLPTEAEWEYAARAGNPAEHYGEINQIAWWGAHHGNGNTTVNYQPCYQKYGKCWGPQPVGTKDSNAWGLYDMLGNVWEWVYDWYSDSYRGTTVVDPIGPTDGSTRVLRGGGWDNSEKVIRISFRYWWVPTDRVNNVGFRILRVEPLTR